MYLLSEEEHMKKKPLTKILDLQKPDYYETHLEICNALLPKKMTKKEIAVLAAFLSFEGDLAKDRFGTTARKMVRDQLGLTSGGLGNYLKSLKDKGFLISANGNYQIRTILFPDPEKQEYMLRLVKKQ